jgi:hypothetical protein
MAYIQRPGARVIASEYEWKKVGRFVVPDAVPIIILWPSSPIRMVYELEDTGPPITRDSVNDPFAVTGTFNPCALSALQSSLKKQKTLGSELKPGGKGSTGQAARVRTEPQQGHGATEIELVRSLRSTRTVGLTQRPTESLPFG